MHQTRRNLLIAPFAASLAFAASGCGAPGPLPESTDPDDSVGTVTEAFNTPDVCSMIKGVAAAASVFGGSNVTLTQHCNAVTLANTYFNGAAAVDHTLNDLKTLPSVTTGAYYCAIADSTGATVDGTAHSGLGRFGLSSQFDVTTRDPSHNTLTGYRTGTLWLFGAPAKLESQAITITDNGEGSSDGRFWGGYLGVTTSSTNWDIGGSVTFPVGPALVTVSPGIQVISPTASDTNDSIAFSGSQAGNTRASTYSYSAWLPCVSAGTCPRSLVGNGEFQLDHAFACPTTSMTSLTDGVLPYYNPYGGAGCSSQNFIYIDGLHNWLEFGRPVAVHSTSPQPNVPPTRPDEEKNHTLQSGTDSANATFLASLGVQVKFSVDIVDITLGTTVHLASRDGFGVYQQHTRAVDAKQGDINLWTQLNAQTRGDATIAGTVAVSILPPLSFSFTIPITDTGNKEAVNPVPTNFNNDQYPAPVHMHYYDEGTQGLHSYSVNTVYKTDADGSRLACMFDTTTQSSQPPLAENAGGFLKSVATNAVNAVHPCLVKTCQADGTHETDYDWNSSQQKLVQSSSSTGTCTICNQVVMNLCDSSGNVLQGTNQVRSGQISLAPASHCSR